MISSHKQLCNLSKGLFIYVSLFFLVTVFLHFLSVDSIARSLLLRVPLLAGILLFSLPVISFYLLPTLLENLFVLENSLRLTVVTIQAAVTGLGIVVVWLVINHNAGCRFLGEDCFDDPVTLTNTILPYLWGVILAIPVAYASCSMSDINKRQKLLGVALGVFFVIAIYCSIYLLRQNDSLSLLKILEQMLVLLLSAVLPKAQQIGFINPNTGSLAAGHLLALSFMVITIAIYAICYFAYRPSSKPGKLQAPALYYVLVLIIAYTFVLGLLTFFLDYYRVPTVLIALFISWALFTIFNTDHFFKLKHLPEDKEVPKSVQQALKKRLQINNTGKLVVVCASGGGIQAAGWTTMVLIQLQNLLGKSFANSIGLISSVSGGSVGAMHYLDSMNTIPDPDKKQLFNIFQNATKNSLDATGWGLAYPDLWRIMGAPFLPAKMNDRGGALETDWKSVMHDADATFNSWRSRIVDGVMPFAVFNSTQVENGKRLLLSPISFSNTTGYEQTDFNSLYKNYDIDVTTAARLSATFAYVSPIARDNQNVQSFHAADGGYFDNYGVFTANQWLTDEVLPFVDDLGIKQIIFIEIRAFSVQMEQKPDTSITSQSRSGWIMALLGPLLTLANVRNATQNTRNEYDVDIMEVYQSKQIDFHTYTIEFPAEITFFETKTPQMVKKVTDKLSTKNYTPPLSWKLSNRQKKAICRGWYQIKNNPSASSYKDLRHLIETWEKN